MLKRRLLPFFFFLVLIAPVFSQLTPAEKLIMKPVEMLFDGMYRTDTAMVHSAFVEEATLSTVTVDKNGHPALRASTLQSFFHAIATPHPEPWSEMIWDPEIKSDGNFAQVWVKYAFYVGKTFSHCGVDAFHLVKNQEGHWKIFHLADTRHKDNCEIPSSISEKFK